MLTERITCRSLFLGLSDQNSKIEAYFLSNMLCLIRVFDRILTFLSRQDRVPHLNICEAQILS